MTKEKLSWKSSLQGMTLSDNILTENLHKKAACIFFQLNQEIASVIIVSGERLRLDLNKLFELIMKEFKVSEDQIIIDREYEVTADKDRLFQVLLLIEKNLLIEFNFIFTYSVTVFHNCQADSKKIERILKLADECKSPPPPRYVNILVEQSGKLSLRPFEVATPKEDSIMLNYNADFEEVDRIIREKLLHCEKGIALFHGPPGTGKTSFIRYLISIIKKRIIYIPANGAAILGSPDFLRFISDYPQSIIVIEDAEDIISERGTGGGYSISNLLNISDGILSDCLRLQVICTFNCSINKIDKALLRKGRLLARYEFGLLDIERAQRLADTLGITEKITKKMSLANIYNMADKDFGVAEVIPIGFKTA